MRKNGLFGAFALTLAVGLLPTAVILQDNTLMDGEGASWQEMLLSRILPKLDQFTGFDTIGQIIDATIEEDCVPLSCPNGFTRTANPLYAPTSNGCGTLGFQWKRDFLPDEALEECCNVHDLCYDNCGADKDLCDLHFKRCLYKVCNGHRDEWTPSKMKACKGAAKLMYTGTQAFGCKAFQDSQSQSCQCSPTTATLDY